MKLHKKYFNIYIPYCDINNGYMLFSCKDKYINNNLFYNNFWRFKYIYNNTDNNCKYHKSGYFICG